MFPRPLHAPDIVLFTLSMHLHTQRTMCFICLCYGAGGINLLQCTVVSLALCSYSLLIYEAHNSTSQEHHSVYYWWVPKCDSFFFFLYMKLNYDVMAYFPCVLQAHLGTSIPHCRKAILVLFFIRWHEHSFLSSGLRRFMYTLADRHRNGGENSLGISDIFLNSEFHFGNQEIQNSKAG